MNQEEQLGKAVVEYERAKLELGKVERELADLKAGGYSYPGAGTGVYRQTVHVLWRYVFSESGEDTHDGCACVGRATTQNCSLAVST